MRLALGILAVALAAEEPSGTALFAELAPTRVSLTYVAPAPVGSAGVFGHVLLVLHGARGAVAVGYAAESADDDSIPVMAWRGLTGGYDGIYQLDPYAEKLKEYGAGGGRAAWAYDLDLAPGDLSRLLEQLATEQPRRTPYRLLDRNCSTALIDLLAAAHPGVVAKPWLFAEPADVVRAAQAAGLTGEGRRLPGAGSGVAPEGQCGTTRIAWGGGSEAGIAFLSLGLRPAWHGIDDPASGELGTGISILDLDLRWFAGAQTPILQQADLLNVAALAPDPGRRSGTAWRLSVGSLRVRQAGGSDQELRVAYGWGCSWRPDPRLLGYALLMADARAIADVTQAAGGAGIEVGTLVRQGSWQGAAWARSLAWAGTDAVRDHEAGARLGYAVQRDQAIQAEASLADVWGCVTGTLSMRFSCYF